MRGMTGSSGTGQAAAASGGVLSSAVRYTVLIAQLAAAALRLRGLSGRVEGTYRYVEGCSTSVDRLAEQMATLTVDRDSVGEHHQAAAVMRGVLADAAAMAEAIEDLAQLFDDTAAAHEADYGPVAEAIAASPVPMADASFYSNR
ncbi:hypothetical protein [Nonomuraea typhae]|uniref:Uncharacterized protein n=1 Tax=Nonomuraea typhae TaxID=2603600 RepID=A0ABW7Z8C9_9ACTN